MRNIRNIICLFSVLIIIPAFLIKATTTTADSLEKVLLQTKDQKIRLVLLNQLAKEYALLSFEKSIQYGNQAISLSHELNEPQAEIDALFNIGDAYSFQNNFKESNDYYKKVQKLSEKIKYKKGVAAAINGLGQNSYYEGKIDVAFQYYTQALSYAKINKIKTEEGNALINMGQVNRKKSDSKSAEKYYTQALNVFESINDINGLAKVYNSLGIIQYEAGNNTKAIEYYEKALKYRLLTGEKKGSAILYNNIGNVLLKSGKYDQAIGYFQNALKIFEEIDYREGIASSSNSIGLIYLNFVRGTQYKQNIMYYNKSLEFLQKALKIYEQLKKDLEVANSYNNIGNIYAKINNDSLITLYGSDWEDNLKKNELQQVETNYLKIIEYYKKSLSLSEKIGYKQGIANSFSNLGKICNSIGSIDLARTYLEKALKLDKELDNRYEASYALVGIGKIYSKVGNYSKALEYLYQSLNIATKDSFTEVSKNAYSLISLAYQSLGDFQKSLQTYKRYIEIQDSMVNENNMKQIAELQTQYETDKKDKEIQLLNKDADLKRAQFTQTVIYFSAGLILVLVITVFFIRQNRERKRTNIELEAKNSLITEQKQEITDSIQYASRIQKAVMIVESQLKMLLPNSFIYFRPRDIVSGDFFWVNEKNGKIIVVAADCTGHGVPGAFMSMLGMSMFKSIVVENDELHADEILNDLRLRIIDSLHQTGKSGENKDGMDLALYIYDPVENILEYAGANNPLYVVRNGELIETKADRMPIGIHEKSMQPFTKHIINVEKGDMIYTFSDGYHDQFGGPDNKKFMSGNLKKLLAKIHGNPVEKQHDILHTTITEWMKDTYQIDDILIIGVRV